MAKKQADTVRLNFEVELKSEHLTALAKMMNEVPGHTEAQYARDMAELLLEQQASGGVMFGPEEVKMVADATGVTLDNAENLIPYITETAGMEDGFHRVTVLIDPANYPAYEELARTQERSVDSLLQEVVDMIQENEWVYELHPRPKQILMTEAQADQLAELLGKAFANGSELFQLILKKLALPKEEDGESLFADDAEERSNVGAEA